MNQIKSSIQVLAIVLVMTVIANKVQSQVSIGVPVPSGSAMLDVSSTTKGFLPPRMSEIQRVLIFKPDAGLIVYQTDGKKGLYYYDGTSWTYVMNQLIPLSPSETPIAIGGGVRDNISTLGTVVSAPTFITSEWSNVGGFAGKLRTPRLVYGNNFDGTANLTSGLISDGITSSSTLAVGTNATITGTLTLTSLSTSSLLVTNGSKTVVSGSLTGDITTTGLVATLSNTGVISGTYGSSTAVPQITVDSKGRITTITTTSITASGGGTISHTIGESYGGGIVFYVYDNGQHGLIAARSNQSSGIRWYGGSYTNTRARANGVGAGLKNTAIIIANQGAVDGNAFAATVCNEYTVTETTGGITTTYGDWYLPSTYELGLMYTNIGKGASSPNYNIGVFADNFYWSSTEFSKSDATAKHFLTGGETNGGKEYSGCYVRAIRAF